MAKCSLHSTTRNFSNIRAKPRFKSVLQHRFLTTASQATTTTSSSSHPATNPNTSRQTPLTLVHKVSKLVPQVLEYGSASSRDEKALKLEDWEKILGNVYEDLSSSTPRPIRLAAYGLDSASGSEDFVTALLSNPLGSSDAQAEILRSRWEEECREKVVISYGVQASSEGNIIELSAPFLRQFSVPVQVVELRPSRIPSNQTPSTLPDEALAKLFEADIPIILCNPLTSSIQSLLSTPLPSNTIVVVTSTPSQSLDPETLLASVPKYTPRPTVVVVDPKRAAEAITLLQSSHASSTIVQRFQDAFNGSNISSVTRAVQAILSPLPNSTSLESDRQTDAASLDLKTKLALARLHDALFHCRSRLAEVKRLLNAAFVDASHLTDRVEEVRARVELDFLGPAHGSPASTSSPRSHGKPRLNEVNESLRTGEALLKTTMARLTWWRMVTRVDEITNLVAAALHRTWCPELERKLLVHTGELQSIQNELTETSFNLLSKHRILPTNVLRNSLLQLEASPQHRLTTNSLTAPIYARRNQIVEYPTARLHVTAQRAVLGMSGGIVGGAGIGWVGWMGWLVGSGEGLLGSLGLDPATAMGLGALTAVASVRWGVGRWEKGKRKWWDDWRRVGDGLDRDLRTTLDRCIQQQVGGVAQATGKGFTRLIAQREEDVTKFREEVQRLDAELQDARSTPTADRK